MDKNRKEFTESIANKSLDRASKLFDKWYKAQEKTGVYREADLRTRLFVAFYYAFSEGFADGVAVQKMINAYIEKERMIDNE